MTVVPDVRQFKILMLISGIFCIQIKMLQEGLTPVSWKEMPLYRRAVKVSVASKI